jgi:hypothetical protein
MLHVLPGSTAPPDVGSASYAVGSTQRSPTRGSHYRTGSCLQHRSGDISTARNDPTPLAASGNAGRRRRH